MALLSYVIAERKKSKSIRSLGDSRLKIWDMRMLPSSMNASENKYVREYKGHKCNGYNVVSNFYNKEKYLVTGSEDGLYIFMILKKGKLHIR